MAQTTPTTTSLQADYIVVGAGPAGSALATRLAEGDPAAQVLLIEAGPAKPSFLSVMPAGLALLVPSRNRHNYAYQTVPQASLGGRTGYVPPGRGLVRRAALLPPQRGQPAPGRPGRGLARSPGPAGGERPGLAQPRERGLCGGCPGLRPAGQCRLQRGPARGRGPVPGVSARGATPGCLACLPGPGTTAQSAGAGRGARQPRLL